MNISRMTIVVKQNVKKKTRGIEREDRTQNSQIEMPGYYTPASATQCTYYTAVIVCSFPKKFCRIGVVR